MNVSALATFGPSISFRGSDETHFLAKETAKPGSVKRSNNCAKRLFFNRHRAIT
ncbi:MAG: hypothetical protein K0R61_5109 [Microvirga sp.]|nr:hypothetical protein [Microvirga sp.]